MRMTPARGSSRRSRRTCQSSTSADITVALRSSGRKHVYSGLIVNTVHDEIVVECQGGYREVAQTVKSEMMQPGKALLKEVPMEVDVEIGSIWAK